MTNKLGIKGTGIDLPGSEKFKRKGAGDKCDQNEWMKLYKVLYALYSDDEDEV